MKAPPRGARPSPEPVIAGGAMNGHLHLQQLLSQLIPDMAMARPNSPGSQCC